MSKPSWLRTCAAPLRWGAAVLILLAALAVTFPGLTFGYALPSSYEGEWASDLFDVGAPLRACLAATLRAGRLPLWYPGAYGGLPLAGIPEAVPYYPPSTLFYLLFSPTRATAWTLAFHLLFAGAGAALLAQRLGAGFLGRVLAGVIVALGLFLPNHFRQMNLLQTAAWTPWAWLALERCLSRADGRGCAQLGLACGGMLLAGHLQIAHHTAVFLGVWAVLRVAASWPGRRQEEPLAIRDWSAPAWGRRLMVLAGAALLALALGSPHVAPQLELTLQSSRLGVSSAEFQNRFPPYLASLATLLNPGINGTPMDNSDPHGIYWENSLYCGLTPLLLALAGLALGARRARRPVMLPLAGALLASLVFVYGWLWSPLAALLRLVPGAGVLRFPQRYLWFTELALALLAGLGLTWLQAWVRPRLKIEPRLLRTLGALLVLITLLDLSRNVSSVCPLAAPGDHWREPESSALLKRAGAQPGAFGERVANYGLNDAGIFSQKVRGGWGGPTGPTEELRGFLSAERCSLWGWSSVQGYLGLIPRWSQEAVLSQHEPGVLLLFSLDFDRGLKDAAAIERWARWAGALGARWVVSAYPLASPSLAALGAAAGRTFKVYLYRNQAWLGPAWITHRAVRQPEERQAIYAHLVGRNVSLKDEILVAGEAPRAEAPAAGAGPESVKIDAATPERFRAQCTLAAPGYLVLNTGYHPRWRARLDGEKELTPLRANVSQMAVALPVGAHRVEFIFSGRLEIGSLCLAAFASLILLWLLIRLGARFRPPASMGEESAREDALVNQ